MDKSSATHRARWTDGSEIPLTELEYQIVERMRWGRLKENEIAGEIPYAPKTVKNCLHEFIYPKLGVSSRLQAVMTLMTASVT